MNRFALSNLSSDENTFFLTVLLGMHGTDGVCDFLSRQGIHLKCSRSELVNLGSTVYFMSD